MDANLAYWSAALANLGVIVACALLGVRAIRAGDMARHRRWMGSGGALIGLFLVSYLFKLIWLGRENRELWTASMKTSLYVHELCIAVMLAAGGYAGLVAWRFRRSLGPGPQLDRGDAPSGSLARHRRAGRVAVIAASVGFVTAFVLLAGMYEHY